MSFFKIVGAHKGKDIALAGVNFIKGVAEVTNADADKLENMLTSYYGCQRVEKLPTVSKKTKGKK
jgi:hypothetical protein